VTTYYTRSGTYQAGTTARGETVKADLDAVVSGFEAVDTDIKRAIKLPSGADIEITDTASARADKVVGFDSAGDVAVLAVADISASLDTLISGAANGDVLIYNSTSGNWENKTKADAGLVTLSGTETLTGNKTFSGTVALNGAVTLGAAVNCADQDLTSGNVVDGSEQFYDAGNKTGASQTVDYTNGHWQKITLTGNVTSFSVSNWPASGKVGSVTLEIHQDGTGGYTFALPAGFKTADGAGITVTTTAGAISIITLITRDAGTSGFAVQNGLAWA